MLVEQAKIARVERYARWYALLEEELALVASTGASFVAVGKLVSAHLLKRGFSRAFTRIIYYSGQAASARGAGIVGRKDSFASFRTSVSLDDLIANAKDVLLGAGVPMQIRPRRLHG